MSDPISEKKRVKNYSEAQSAKIREAIKNGFANITPKPAQRRKPITNRAILSEIANSLFERINEGYSVEQVFEVLSMAGYQSTIESFRRLVQTMKVERAEKPKQVKR